MSEVKIPLNFCVFYQLLHDHLPNLSSPDIVNTLLCMGAESYDKIDQTTISKIVNGKREITNERKKYSQALDNDSIIQIFDSLFSTSSSTKEDFITMIYNLMEKNEFSITAQQKDSLLKTLSSSSADTALVAIYRFVIAQKNVSEIPEFTNYSKGCKALISKYKTNIELSYNDNGSIYANSYRQLHNQIINQFLDLKNCTTPFETVWLIAMAAYYVYAYIEDMKLSHCRTETPVCNLEGWQIFCEKKDKNCHIIKFSIYDLCSKANSLEIPSLYRFNDDNEKEMYLSEITNLEDRFVWYLFNSGIPLTLQIDKETGERYFSFDCLKILPLFISRKEAHDILTSQEMKACYNQS